jgi:ATP-dependent DNA ligase
MHRACFLRLNPEIEDVLCWQREPHPDIFAVFKRLVLVSRGRNTMETELAEQPSPKKFDALVIGYYDGPTLYMRRAPGMGSRRRYGGSCSKKLRLLEIKECPFANLPEKKAGRRGAGLTATKMAECRWLKPLVAQFEFVNWTEDLHLRHSQFMALRDDKKAKDVRRVG